MEVADQIVVPLDLWLGHTQRGLRPEAFPPGGVRRPCRLPTGGQGGPDTVLRQRQRFSAVARGGDGERQHRRLADAGLSDTDAVAQAGGRLLHEPGKVAICAGLCFRVAQRAHRGRGQQAESSGGRAGKVYQRYGAGRGEEGRGSLRFVQPGVARRARQVQLESPQACACRQGDLQPARGQLAGVDIAVVAVEDGVDLGRLLLLHQADEVGVGERLPVHARGRALVPEITAVQ